MIALIEEDGAKEEDIEQIIEFNHVQEDEEIYPKKKIIYPKKRRRGEEFTVVKI